MTNRLLLISLGAAVLTLTGCYSPAYPDPPTYNCSNASPEAARCPEGYACNGARCVPAGQLRDSGADAPLVDGPLTDGPALDGPGPDATLSDLAADQATKGWKVVTLAGTGSPGKTNGPAATAQFSEPLGLAVGAAGEIYIADALNHCVRKLHNNVVSTFAGTCGAGGYKDGAAASAKFFVPSGIVARAGKLYVVDSGNNCIRAVEQGTVSTLAGTCGSLKFGMADGPVASAKFRSPVGIEVTPSGTVYVADMGNHCIRKIASQQVSTHAGVCKYGLYNGGFFNNSDRLKAWFDSPVAVILDASNRLIVADSGNNCLRYVDTAVGTLAGKCGKLNGGLKEGPALQARFTKPTAVAIDPAGGFLVTDQGNHLVRRIAGGLVSTFAGAGTQGFKDGPAPAAFLDTPTGIRVPSVGQIVFADSHNDRIRAVVPAP